MAHPVDTLPQERRQSAKELHAALAKACGCWPLKEHSHTAAWNSELQVREQMLDVHVLDDDGAPYHPWATFVTSAIGDVLAVRLAKDPASFGEIAELVGRLAKHRDATGAPPPTS